MDSENGDVCMIMIDVLECPPQVVGLGATSIPRYSLFKSLADEGERMRVVCCLESLKA